MAKKQKAKKPLSEAQQAAIAKMQQARKEKLELKQSGTAAVESPVVPTPEEASQPVEEPIAPAAPSEFSQLDDNAKDQLIIKLQAEIIENLKNGGGAVLNKEKAIDDLSSVNFGAARISAQGGVQGIVFKYPVEKGHYKDPTDRLYDDPKLTRHALRENYLFTWDVEGETYEKNGITYTEPRFIVELYRHIFDDEGEKTKQVARVARTFLHQDEFVAVKIAAKLGISDMFATKDELLDEVLYNRIRGWLLELFTPVKFQQFKKRAKSMVIEGKVVEVLDTEDVIGAETADLQASTLRS